MKVASRDIIVIDSDSDDDVHGRENGKRSTPPDSRTRVSEDFQSQNSATSIPAHSEDNGAFGVPSELLRPINPRVEASNKRFYAHQHFPIAPKPDHSESMFGVSAPLLEQTCVSSCFWTLCGVGDGLNLPCTGNQLTERSQTNLVAHESMSTMAGINSVSGVVVEFPTGEWAVGDDELVALEVSDNSAEIDEVEGELSHEQRFCPVCGINLTGILVIVSAVARRCHTNSLTSAIPC